MRAEFALLLHHTHASRRVRRDPRIGIVLTHDRDSQAVNGTLAANFGAVACGDAWRKKFRARQGAILALAMVIIGPDFIGGQSRWM